MKAVAASKSTRYCPEYSDGNFVIVGVSRVIASASSGRDWVQQACARMGFFVSVSSFFQALKSPRRFSLSKEVAEYIRKQVDQDCDARFDPLSKLQEKKAWATSAVARSQQALFVCMAHNLMLLLECRLEGDENLRDEKNQAKRQKRIEELKRRILANGRKPNPLVIDCTRTTQRSLQFIRWLRNVLFFPTSWEAEITALRPLMARYLL